MHNFVPFSSIVLVHLAKDPSLHPGDAVPARILLTVGRESIHAVDWLVTLLRRFSSIDRRVFIVRVVSLVVPGNGDYTTVSTGVQRCLLIGVCSLLITWL